MFVYRFMLFFLYVNYSFCDWWKNTVIYEIYPYSFMDSDDDRIGDIKGIISKLDYFQELGIDCLYIPYLYPSTNYYSEIQEIKNHTAIDGLLGTMSDFDMLLKELKKKEMKIIIDFVPNHTSYRHYWFQMSLYKQSKYSNYYIWRNPKKQGYDEHEHFPNNWKAVDGSNAWHYWSNRRQFNYVSYSARMPDLNLRNDEVVGEITDILRFWLKKGVDGIVIKSPDNLIEDKYFRNDIYFENDIKIHYSKFNEESYQLLRRLRDIIEEYEENDGKPRLIIAETHNLTKEIYGTFENIGHSAINGRVLSQHIRHAAESSAVDLVDLIHQYCDKARSSAVVWSVGIQDELKTELHNERRIPSMYEDESVDIVNALTLLLPGIGYTYYGQELGVKGVHDQDWDKYSRHLGVWKEDITAKFSERFPMPWNDSIHGGFTRAYQPWFSVIPDYWRVNVEQQKLDSNSHLNFYKTLIKLRKMSDGNDTMVWHESETVLALSRSSFYVLINLGHETVDQHIGDAFSTKSKNSTIHVITGSINSIQKHGDVIKPNAEEKIIVALRPRSAFIFKVV